MDPWLKTGFGALYNIALNYFNATIQHEIICLSIGEAMNLVLCKFLAYLTHLVAPSMCTFTTHQTITIARYSKGQHLPLFITVNIAADIISRVARSVDWMSRGLRTPCVH